MTDDENVAHNWDKVALRIANELYDDGKEYETIMLEYARRLRAEFEKGQEPWLIRTCKHEPFEGRCIHCQVQFKDGYPIRTAPYVKLNGLDDLRDRKNPAAALSPAKAWAKEDSTVYAQPATVAPDDWTMDYDGGPAPPDAQTVNVPTEEMIAAGDEAIVEAIQPRHFPLNLSDGDSPALRCWNAMLAAAPQSVNAEAKALRIAAGMISTLPEFSNQHPEDVLKYLMDAAIGERK